MAQGFIRAFAAGLLLCSGAFATAEPRANAAVMEQSVRDSMNIPADMPVEYQDTSGKPMAARAFAAAIRKHKLAAAVDNSSPGKVILRLQEAPSTQSFPTHLPALEARDLTGRPVRNVHLGGKHTLLSFYFSGCVPCIQEVPALNAYRAAHPELNYLAITFDPAVDARRFVRERQLDWPVIADAGGFLRDAGVRSFPGYMLVAPDGRILGRGAGLTLNSKEATPGLASLEKFVSKQLKGPK